jgi:hypothetical protein
LQRSEQTKKGGMTMEHSTPATDESLVEDQGGHGVGAVTRYGRRAMMLGAGAAGAGLVAALAGSADPAAADNNNPVELGELNEATASTSINTTDGNGLNGFTSSKETYACGLLGESTWGIGVYGTNEPSGYLGADGIPASAGVVGDSKAGTGVLGLS